MRPAQKKYHPALGHTSLNDLYDRFSLWAFKKTAFGDAIQEVIRQLRLKSRLRLLELGCGTARLAIFIKKRHPDCHILGLDGDPKILKLARVNAITAGVRVDLRHQDIATFSSAVKYDRIYSTFVLHHLKVEAKLQTLKMIRKTLKRGGSFILADFCGTDCPWNRLKFLAVQAVDGFETTTPHMKGWLETNLPKFFKRVEKVGQVSTFLGPIAVFICRS